jgi:hypothetical protein
LFVSRFSVLLLKLTWAPSIQVAHPLRWCLPLFIIPRLILCQLDRPGVLRSNASFEPNWPPLFPVDKVNDYSLFELREKWLNSKHAWLSLENAIILIDRQGG